MHDSNYTCGVIGTVLGVFGVSLSINEIQAIVSICVTILGFTVSVLVPLIIKLVKKIKEAKEDKVITKEEREDIISTAKEIIDETGKMVDSLKKDKEEGK